MRVRSSHSLIFFKTGVLRNFKTFTGKYLCWSLFLFFIKKRLQHRCFSVKIAKLRNSFFIERLCLLLPESSISLEWTIYVNTVLKNEVSIKGFLHTCDKIRRQLRICSHLLKKSFTGNFIFCPV